ncbi:MAG: superoxide dismutase [Parcubacteria group bacterium]|nr:superoxide dismutase [Parcubacteria group bacterium]
MPYSPKPLPFSKPLTGISDKTVQIHHDKLYVGYVNKSNEILEKLKALRAANKAEGNATYSELRALKDAETFAINGVYLHEWYFDVLGGKGATEEAPELSKAMIEKWGSVENGIKWFSECAMASRGWSVLAWDSKIGALRHYNGDAHNQGGVWGCLPIIVLDVYEHAYFMDYGSDRKKYIEDFWHNFDWSKAEEMYLKVKDIQL